MKNSIYTMFILLMLVNRCFCADMDMEGGAPERKAVYLYDSKNTKAADRTVNRVVRLKHMQADKAVNMITRIVPNIIAVNKDDDILVLRGEIAVVDEAMKVIGETDVQRSQILIESRVMEISESALDTIGINWGKEQGTFKLALDKATGKAALSDDFIVTMNALVAKGDANVLANPKIITLDGKQAEINIGSRIPYAVPAESAGTSAQWSVRYIDAGVSLRIISNIKADGIIVSNIKPEVSSVSEWRVTAAGEFPVISTRNAEVTVKIKDGETLAIGGLISKSDRENISKLPVLSDIPLLGWLFQKKINEEAKTEVVFLITPHIIP